jgi:hypothetical protein
MSYPKDRSLIEYHLRHGFLDDEELLRFVESFFPDKSGNPFHIPRAQGCLTHTPPAQYICDSYFDRSPNAICWANRGGGKTLLGGLATWLDSMFKPGCSTQILGGSLEQSKKMYDHLDGKSDGWGLINANFRYLLKGEVQTQHASLTNLSTIHILTASPKSVRGTHPQKLKLDEVDEMDPTIYQAALSAPINRHGIKASLHIMSTMHKSYGLMQTVIDDAPMRGYKIYHWCILDILERCEGRECAPCELWDDCQGRAREADGYYPIELAITKKRQVSDQTWLSEYLCRIPSSEGLIYGDFDPSMFV